MSEALDEAERKAIQMIEFFQEECRKQCEPYVKMVARIRSLRPRLMVVDGKTLVPFVSPPMNEFQREVLQQIKQGIDRAKHEGVLVEYPRGVLIDGVWVPWPFDVLPRQSTGDT